MTKFVDDLVRPTTRLQALVGLIGGSHDDRELPSRLGQSRQQLSGGAAEELLMHLGQLTRRQLLVYRPNIDASFAKRLANPMRRLEERHSVLESPRTAANHAFLSFDLSRGETRRSSAGSSGNPDATAAVSGALAPGIGIDRDPALDARLDQLDSRVGDARRSGVGDQRHSLPRLQPREQLRQSASGCCARGS